jgi:CRP/FNR family transcriptional regulator, cyclic AMP receptor protein
MKTEDRPAFNLLALLRSRGLSTLILRCDVGRVIFSTSDAADSVMYLLDGTVKLSVSKSGQEAVVATLRTGDFFGEACLAGQRTRATTATAMTQSAFVMIDRTDMMQLLHAEPALRDRFVEHLLLRNVRAEAALLEAATPSRLWFRRRFAGRPTA